MPDLIGLRSILDEFEHLVSHHDVARRHSEIVANLERAEVDLRWNRPTFDGILQEVLVAVEEGLASAVDGRLYCRRITEQEICGGEGLA